MIDQAWLKTAKLRLLVKINMLFSDCVDDFNLEVFGVILVSHVTGDDALEQAFVNASSGNMIDDCFHALHEVVGVPIVAVMHEEPHTDCQGNSFVGVLELMPGA